MKKALLGTSAIALATAFGSQAGAAEFDMNVGGYFESRVAYSSVDVENTSADAMADYDGVDVKRDNEINFKPSITLDNGIKIGATVELEGATAGDQIDEAYISIDGNFGRILLGSENSARYLMQYAAPSVGSFGVNSGDATAHVPISGGGRGSDIFRGTLGSSYIENGRNNDAERITYFTPRMSGFQFGVSYARDRKEDNNAQVNIDSNGDENDARFSNIVDVAANYVGNVGGVDVAVAAGYGVAFGDGLDRDRMELVSSGPDGDATTTGDNVAIGNVYAGDESDNPTVWNAGVNFGWQGWKIGGSFAEQNGSSQSMMDGTYYDAGISYATGPWGFSFTYGHGENVDNDNVARNVLSGEELDQYLVGVSYSLAKGVTLNGFGAYVTFEEDGNVTANATSDANLLVNGVGNEVTPGDDLDGFVIGTGIRISF